MPIIYIDNEPVLWPHDTITGAQLRQLKADMDAARIPGYEPPLPSEE